MQNIPEVKLGIVAVSRDCFPITLSEKRRKAVVAALKAKGYDIYESPVIIEGGIDGNVMEAYEDIQKSGINALVVFLGNFGPEGPETLIAKKFGGPVMYVAAAEENIGVLSSDRGDAYCGMLNASYNLKLNGVNAYIPEYPVGTAEECADMILEFIPIARTLLALKDLKIITFGPRPFDFLACNAPIAPLFKLGVNIQENSELDLLAAYKAHANDPRIPAKIKEVEYELGEGNKMPGILPRLAQYELTLLDWVEANKGAAKYVAMANKCWPAFQTEFGFVPCYVNSRLTAMGIPTACEVDIYGALSEFIGTCVTGESVTLLDINNSVPADMYLSLIHILVNECRNIQRRWKKRGEPLDESRAALEEAPPDPGLRDALMALPERLRLPLVLHYLEGYSLREISSILKIPQTTVKSRLHQARGALRRELSTEVEL